MNSRNKNLPIIIVLLSVVLFFFLIFMSVRPVLEDYSDSESERQQQEKTFTNAQREHQKQEAQKNAETIAVKNIKQIYEASANETNMSLFGDMFKEITDKAQANNLLIRSMEYVMNPEEDPIYLFDPEAYNVAELRFFFVCTYADFLNFLTDINNNFNYLFSISGLDITDFEERPNYLLAKVSITLYSKKKIDKSANQKNK